jgi:hypothetical protein
MWYGYWDGTIVRPLHTLNTAHKNKDTYARTECESNKKLHSLYHVISAQEELISLHKIFLGP